MRKTSKHLSSHGSRYVRRGVAALSAVALSCALLPAAAFAGSDSLAAGSPSQPDTVQAPGLSAQASSVVKSAKKTTKKSASFKIKQYGTTKKYSHARAKWAYGKPVIKGKTSAANAMNKSLNKRYKAYRKDLARFLRSAKKESRSMRYTYTYSTKATYNSNGYVSFRYTWGWFAGGVANSGFTGDTYSLATGKRLNVSQVVSGGATAVKRKIADALYSKYNLGAYDKIMSKKITSFNFYLRNGKVVVAIDPYTFPGQRGALSVTLKGDYE